MEKRAEAQKAEILKTVGDWYDKRVEEGAIDDGCPCGKIKIELFQDGWDRSDDSEDAEMLFSYAVTITTHHGSG